MTSRKTRIACIGECMLEFSQFDPNKGKFAVGPAGDTLNTAAYLAQLLPKDAFDVSYVTALGIDQFSDWISEQIAQWGISTDLIMRSPDKLPGLYAIELDDAGERTFRCWRQQSAARDMGRLGALSPERLADFDLIYLSGISLAILDTTSRQNLIDTCGTLRKAGCSIAFDSNYRPGLWESEDAARAASSAIQQHVEIALPSYDDEVILWGESTELDVIARIHAQGPSEIIMTTGATSAWVDEKEDEPYRLTLTRMVQSVLSEPEWASRLSERDYRGLSPLIYSHINPYGRFDVDLEKRIDFGAMVARFIRHKRVHPQETGRCDRSECHK